MFKQSISNSICGKNEQTIFEGFNREVYQSLQNWAKQHLPQASREIEPFGVGKFYELQGPTGESNQYIILPRHRVLSIADTEQNQLHQLLAIFAVGSQAAVMPNSPLLAKHKQTLPKDVLDAITTIKTSLQMILMLFCTMVAVKRFSHYSKKLQAALVQL